MARPAVAPHTEPASVPLDVEQVELRQLAGSVEKPSLPVPLSVVGEEKSRGTLTSWGWHPERGGVGLALVRRELTQPGTRLAGNNREFEVTSLPLW